MIEDAAAKTNSLISSDEIGKFLAEMINSFNKIFEKIGCMARMPVICGYQEIIELIDIGEVIAKFDTGNGALSILHANDIVINKDGRTVSFNTLNQKFTRPIVRGFSSSKGQKVSISSFVKFNNNTYKDVEFLLDNREGKDTSVSLSRDFMDKLNIIINPGKTFLLKKEVKNG
jgi:hypothetical protein